MFLFDKHTCVNSLPTSVVCWKPLQTNWTQIKNVEPDLIPICLKPVDGIPERIYEGLFGGGGRGGGGSDIHYSLKI